MTLASSVLLALALSLVKSPAAATSWALTLDPTTTEIRFAVDSTLHLVEGTARLVRGEIRFDPATGDADGEVVVDASSLESGNGRRDRDMHRKVLASREHQQIVLRPDRLLGNLSMEGPSSFVLQGRFEIRGREHAVRLNVRTSIESSTSRIWVSFIVPYVEWGMKSPGKLFLRVDKEVRIEIEAIAALRPIG